MTNKINFGNGTKFSVTNRDDDLLGFNGNHIHGLHLLNIEGRHTRDELTEQLNMTTTKGPPSNKGKRAFLLIFPLVQN